MSTLAAVEQLTYHAKKPTTMKFTHKSFPVLRMLEEEKLGVMGFFEPDAGIGKNPHFMQAMKENFYTFSKFYKQNIAYITTPFAEAITKSMASLTRDDLWENVGQEFGTILRMGWPFDGVSVMYYINGEQGSKTHTSVLYYFSKDIFLGYSVNSPAHNESVTLLSHHLIDQMAGLFTKLNGGQPLTRGQLKVGLLNLVYTNVIAYINFTKYAKVETKELRGGAKLKDVACNYMNDTKASVKILNSTWFTNLVKSDAFKVRGHFRLQACGEGRKERRLVWINEFEKSGYMAPARKPQGVAA